MLDKGSSLMGLCWFRGDQLLGRDWGSIVVFQFWITHIGTLESVTRPLPKLRFVYFVAESNLVDYLTHPSPTVELLSGFASPSSSGSCISQTAKF